MMVAQVQALLGPLPDEAREFLERQCRWAVQYGSDRGSPVVAMLGHVGNYWRSAVLLFLRLGPLRPSELRAVINTAPTPPISKRMLTLNLRWLEQDGLIARKVHDTAQAHVEYRLTDLGRELSDLSSAITEWGAANAPHVMAARHAFEERSADPWA